MIAHAPIEMRAAAAITSSTTTNGSAKTFPSDHVNGLIVVSTVSARTDGTFTTTLQHSPDGSTWFDLVACAAQSANGSVVGTVAADTMIFPFIRSSVLSATVTSGATVAVKVWHGVERR
jgi:hypothetical protein